MLQHLDLSGVSSTHRVLTVFFWLRLIVARVQILPEIRMGNPFEMMRLQSLDKLTLPQPLEANAHVAQARDLGKKLMLIGGFYCKKKKNNNIFILSEYCCSPVKPSKKLVHYHALVWRQCLMHESARYPWMMWNRHEISMIKQVFCLFCRTSFQTFLKL